MSDATSDFDGTIVRRILRFGSDVVIGGFGYHGEELMEKGGFWKAMKDAIQKRGGRLVLPLPTDGANCTCRKVQVRMLGLVSLLGV